MSPIRAPSPGPGGALAEGGLMILSTPNRTMLSRLAMITVGEGTGMIPKGTHDWRQFLRPEELTELLEGVGLVVSETCGLTFSPARGFVLGADTSMDYLVTARRA
jgi:2-polyprenyl-6-hydroxyphenyl methylase/3-demethylubiquinone-9 3-methyltransferase